MSKPFAVFDIDGTIFRSSLLIEVVEAMIAAGVLPESVEDEILQAQENWRNRNHINAYVDYLEKVIVAFEDNIAGVSVDKFNQISEQIINSKSLHTYVFTRNLIKQLSDSHVLFAISGSPEPLVQRFAEKYGFLDFVGSEYYSENGLFTGQASLASEKKEIILDRLVKKHELEYAGSIAVGDTRGDIGLLGAVENPIAFNPDESLRAAAQDNGWKIVIERKSQIYTLENNGGKYELA
jgi:HAD superfamily hydrolase (TIGR01490 family)